MTAILDLILAAILVVIELLPDLDFVNIEPEKWEGLIELWGMTSVIVPYATIFGATAILWSVQNAKLLWGIANWILNKLPITG